MHAAAKDCTYSTHYTVHGPCTYRHFNFPFQMENEKWKMDTHFPFSIYDEK